MPPVLGPDCSDRRCRERPWPVRRSADDRRRRGPSRAVRSPSRRDVWLLHDRRHRRRAAGRGHRFDRAVGPMQFIPSTWMVVGVDGDADGRRDPQDIDDASLATAVYLCSGSDDLSSVAGQRRAVFRYNHSSEYVDLVLRLMNGYLPAGPAAVGSSADRGTCPRPAHRNRRPYPPRSPRSRWCRPRVRLPRRRAHRPRDRPPLTQRLSRRPRRSRRRPRPALSRPRPSRPRPGRRPRRNPPLSCRRQLKRRGRQHRPPTDPRTPAAPPLATARHQRPSPARPSPRSRRSLRRPPPVQELRPRPPAGTRPTCRASPRPRCCRTISPLHGRRVPAPTR